MQAWLKALGTSGGGEIPPAGLASIDWVIRDIGFPVEPSVSVGDRLVLYASGYGKFFGVVEVHLPPYLDNRAAPWSHRCEVRARLVIDELARAPRLEELNVEKDVRKSIRQQSHVRLSDASYGAAVEALERAVDIARGDLRTPSISGRI